MTGRAVSGSPRPDQRLAARVPLRICQFPCAAPFPDSRGFGRLECASNRQFAHPAYGAQVAVRPDPETLTGNAFLLQLLRARARKTVMAEARQLLCAVPTAMPQNRV
jgi:hypothetical protein